MRGILSDRFHFQQQNNFLSENHVSGFSNLELEPGSSQIMQYSSSFPLTRSTTARRLVSASSPPDSASSSRSDIHQHYAFSTASLQAPQAVSAPAIALFNLPTPPGSRDHSPASSARSISTGRGRGRAKGKHPRSSTERKLDRKRAEDANYIPRPRNSFILFRNWFVEKYKREAEATGSTTATLAAAAVAELRGKKRGRADTSDDEDVDESSASLSKQASQVWAGMTAEQKAPWKAAAEIEKDEHSKKYPGYRFRPKRQIMGHKPTSIPTKSANSPSLEATPEEYIVDVLTRRERVNSLWETSRPSELSDHDQFQPIARSRVGQFPASSFPFMRPSVLQRRMTMNIPLTLPPKLQPSATSTPPLIHAPLPRSPSAPIFLGHSMYSGNDIPSPNSSCPSSPQPTSSLDQEGRGAHMGSWNSQISSPVSSVSDPPVSEPPSPENKGTNSPMLFNEPIRGAWPQSSAGPTPQTLHSNSFTSVFPLNSYQQTVYNSNLHEMNETHDIQTTFDGPTPNHPVQGNGILMQVETPRAAQRTPAPQRTTPVHVPQPLELVASLWSEGIPAVPALQLNSVPFGSDEDLQMHHYSDVTPTSSTAFGNIVLPVTFHHHSVLAQGGPVETIPADVFAGETNTGSVIDITRSSFDGLSTEDGLFLYENALTHEFDFDHFEELPFDFVLPATAIPPSALDELSDDLANRTRRFG